MIDLQNTLFNYRLISTTLETDREREQARGEGESERERERQREMLVAGG